MPNDLFELDAAARRDARRPWRPPAASERDARRPRRLFTDRRLERLTRSHPLTPLLWLAGPALAGLISPLWLGGISLAGHVSYLAVGVLVWTLFEYVLHRWVLHLPAEGEGADIAAYLMHGHHHIDPEDPHRLVATPIQWLSALALFGGLSALLLPTPHWISASTGFVLGYLAYEWIHWSAHHRTPRTRVGRWLRRHHLRHHFESPDARFGISSPLWDVMFRTRRSPRALGQEGAPRNAGHGDVSEPRGPTQPGDAG